jgi:hypothetical protein
MEVQMYTVAETATAVAYESVSESEFVTRYYRRQLSSSPAPTSAGDSMGNWPDCISTLANAANVRACTL